MFNDDDFWSDGDGSNRPIEEILQNYYQIKNGDAFTFIDIEEFEIIIEHFLFNNNNTEALNACDIAINIYPVATEILILKAELLFDGQKYGQALKTLDKLDEIEAYNTASIFLRSDIYLEQFKPELSIALLESKADQFIGSDKIDILHELADIYDEYEDFEAVFNTLKRILEIDRRDDEALHKICFWADFADLQEESIKLHQHITDEDPYNALAWFNLGAARQGLKLYEEAIDAYEYCIAIDEKFEPAYRNMADAYIHIRSYDKAIASLHKNLELGKPEDVIFEALGNCYEKQKDFDRARHYYRQALQLNPADDINFYRIGETYMREKEWEKALKSYSSALSLNKENPAYSLAIGNCFLKLEAYNEALVCFLNAVELKPTTKTHWVALLKGLYLNEFYQEMIEQLEIAEVYCGDKIEFNFYRIAALFALGKSKEATLQLEDALDTNPQKLKLLTDLNPELLQRKSVADLVARYKKKK